MSTLRNNKIDEVGKALMKCLTMQVHLQKKYINISLMKAEDLCLKTQTFNLQEQAS